MTAYANLVSIRVSEVRAVVVRVIVRPQSRRTIAAAAVRNGRRVATVDRLARRRKKRCHMSVAGRGWLPVERETDEKKRPVVAPSAPSRPRLFRSENLHFKLKLAEHSSVKLIRPNEVSNANVDMRQHEHTHFRAA